MAKDSINVNVAHLSRAIDFDNAEAVHSVGASHLREYLDTMFGESLPHEPKARYLVDKVLGSMAVLSTNDEVPEISVRDPIAAIPYWLKYLTPFVDSSQALGKHTAEKLREIEQDKNSLDNDVTMMFGVFDVSSIVIASDLALAHPRHKFYALIERSRSVMPAGHRFLDSPTALDIISFELLLSEPLIKADHRKKLIRLRKTGQRIIDLTELNSDRLRVIAEGGSIS